MNYLHINTLCILAGITNGLMIAGFSILISSIVSAMLMEMRYYNKRATAETEAQLSSNEEPDDAEFKKDK